MKAKQMLCKAPVVRAMLDGRQTQDRRPIGNDRVWASDLIMDTDIVDGKEVSLGFEDAAGCWHKTEERAPYQPGDIIWVRETICDGCIGDPCYRADNDWCGLADQKKPLKGRWRPSIYMPKWACRLWLKVTAVRIERIRDISIEDCIAEGVAGEETPCPVRHDKMHSDAWYDGEGCEACGAMSARELFCSLWHDIYPGSWERNDWVWVTEFERCDKPAEWPGN